MTELECFQIKRSLDILFLLPIYHFSDMRIFTLFFFFTFFSDFETFISAINLRGSGSAFHLFNLRQNEGYCYHFVLRVGRALPRGCVVPTTALVQPFHLFFYIYQEGVLMPYFYNEFCFSSTN